MTCDSCGDTDVADAVQVHRKYLTPGAWDQDPAERVLTEVETWCFVCRTHYPHTLVTNA